MNAPYSQREQNQEWETEMQKKRRLAKEEKYKAALDVMIVLALVSIFVAGCLAIRFYFMR